MLFGSGYDGTGVESSLKRNRRKRRQRIQQESVRTSSAPAKQPRAKIGVVTLSGEVNSQSKREHAETVASRVPNVKQVVNDLQVKNQKASSSQ
jgi:hypothetical protein